MIDNVTNALQVAVLLFCIIVSVIRAAARKSRTWIVLAFFFGCWWMGDVYWLSCLFFFDSVPKISVVSDLNWYASYIFLYLLLRQVAPPDGNRRSLPLIGPAFTMAMAVFYMQWGEYINNLIYASLLGLVMYAVIRRLMEQRRYEKPKALCILILVFCLIEYGLWTTSCYFQAESLSNPYYWFDLLLTASFPFFLIATKKAVSE